MILITMKQLILDTQLGSTNASGSHYLPSYLSALEILLMSEYNQELAMELEYQDLIIGILGRDDLDIADKYKCIDCFALICQKGNLINKCFKNQEFATFCANLTNKMP
jgi:hypothetical protein